MDFVSKNACRGFAPNHFRLRRLSGAIRGRIEAASRSHMRAVEAHADANTCQLQPPADITPYIYI